MSELQTLKCYLNQLPATLLQLLGVSPPAGTIPDPVQQIVDMYQGIDRVSINLIDNFGLFEITFESGRASEAPIFLVPGDESFHSGFEVDFRIKPEFFSCF